MKSWEIRRSVTSTLEERYLAPDILKVTYINTRPASQIVSFALSIGKTDRLIKGQIQ